MAIVAGPTLTSVSTTKRIPAPELEAFARFLQQWVTTAHGGNQTAAGKDLKITQGHISALVRGERGPGLNTLIRLRHKTGATIDSMLGFASIGAADELVERLRATFELEVARSRQLAREATDALLDERAKTREAAKKPGAKKKATAGEKE